NVSNKFARLFYNKRNVEAIEPAIETDKNKAGEIPVMTTRYCILFELGMCLKTDRKHKLKLPLHLAGGNQKYAVEFDCKNCEMKISASICR
ncbi:MAG: U32 family peptidase, partial [Acidobacteria bacterium]|nr:U32 family peptidase [Acidobacteriota bacterium]